MKTIHCTGLSILLPVMFACNGLAQSVTTTATITTYAGLALPADGTAAITQAIDRPESVITDGVGGFYVCSPLQHRVYRVAVDGTITVIAGNGTRGFSGDGGPAASAQLNNPSGVAVDGAGNVFIADTDNRLVRKVTPSGVISTVAGGGTNRLQFPSGVAVDGSGNLFIADAGLHSILIVTPTGGFGKVAEGFAGPSGVAVDGSGNLFIADANFSVAERVFKLSPNGISVVAGGGTAALGDGGPATSARLSRPYGVAVDGSGNLFIAEVRSGRVRKVTPDGVIRTVAGGGTTGLGDGGPATTAQLDGPSAVAVDASGNLFIADTRNNRVRKVTPTTAFAPVGVISTVAGNGILACCANFLRPSGSSGFSGDGGPATTAQLKNPEGVAADGAGNLFIADTGNHRIRKVTPAGVISTVAGNATQGFGGDGGPATSANLNSPRAVAADGSGNVFIADTNNDRVRKVTPAGVISTAAGGGGTADLGDGGPATSAQLRDPRGVAVDGAGNLFIADTGNNRIRKVTPAGVISTVAGNGTQGFSGDGGPATLAQLNGPTDVAVDGSGNIFIADGGSSYAGAGRLRKVTPTGVISTVVAISSSYRVAADGSGNIFIADGTAVRKMTPAGVITTVASNGANSMVTVASFGTNDETYTIIFSGDGGPAASAQLNGPHGLAVDGAGALFIADMGNNRIRNVTFTQQANFSLADRAGMSLLSSGTSPATVVGYARVQPRMGSTTPAGLAIFGFRQNNVLVTEAGVPASPLIRSARIYAEINGPINTGLAIANPNNQPAAISFFFTNSNGDFANGTTTIPANGQIAKFLNESPFNGPSSLSGTFTFSSSLPIAVVALRGLSNARGEFLITTLSVADLRAPAATGTIVLPQFADGAGWTTQTILVNPTDGVLTGTIQFLDPSGNAVTVSVNGESKTSFAYSIPARSSRKLQTSGAASTLLTGSVRVVPASGTAVPSASVIFSVGNGGITISEAGVGAVAAGSAFRLYTETAALIETGIAVANTSDSTAAITLELTKLDGSPVGLTGTLSIPPNGQTAVFLNQIQGFASLPTPFQGILRLTSSVPMSMIGLRGRYNERNEFLMTTIPAVNEVTPPSGSPLFFPCIADSGGFTTQFILFSAQPGSPSSGTMQFFSQTGGAWNATIR